MSSYYNRVIGTLEPSEIARSEDIHLIQSSVQNAFQEMIKDLFGIGCILGEEEESLKLIPTPYIIDQENTNYNETSPWISFSDIYLRQKIMIEKSEIQAIRVTIQNNTNLMPTVFAEIRDADFNLIKEANTKLPITNEDGEKIEFIFNLQHLPVGLYYFVIRPVDINTADLTANGDETQYDTITEDSFQILCDKDGNYLEGLDASYNGVDYLESRLLEAATIANTDMIQVDDENFDLCFEHIFSVGNTYLINSIAPCIVLGEKVYPIDTHVSIDGPSPTGDRIDLVSLTTDGQLNVIKGVPYTGKKSEANYPINTSGLKIAYITTFYGADEEWTCSNCGEINNSNIVECTKCGATTNVKTPIIEQNDDNGITRRRDILERLRRLEKKMDYQTEYNSPSRIKYNCTVDPTYTVNSDFIEDTYNMITTENENGETVMVANDGTSEKNYTWSIVDQSYTVTSGAKRKVKMTGQDVHIPQKKPSNINKDKNYIKITLTDSTTGKGVSQIQLTVKILNSKNKILHTKTGITNSNGILYIDPWTLKLKTGTYKIQTSYGSKTIKNTLKVYSTNNFTATINKKNTTIELVDGSLSQTKQTLGSNVMTGDDSFYKDNITIDTTKGEVYIKKITNNDQTVTTLPANPKDVTSLKYSDYIYKIKSSTTSLQSQYPILNINFDRDCYLQDMTINIKGLKNIDYVQALLFKNDKVFNLNTSRTTYIKYLTNEVKETSFKNIKKSDKIQISSKDEKGFKKTIPIQKKIEKGTYSVIIYGFLKNKKQDGQIIIREYHTAAATKYGAISRVKGTSNPNKVFMEGENLTNRTMNIVFNKIDDQHNKRGTIISKTVDTVDNIVSCTLKHNYEIPAGCYIQTYVSNNGGKTYVEQINNNQVTFNGSGHELKWRLILTGNGVTSPKLLYNKNNKYAFKVIAKTANNIMSYEDYNWCFSTPLLNANAITRLLVANNNVQSSFSEWEFARLWMESEDLNADIDICFSYAYDNYTTAIGTSINNWGKDIFFSQIFASLHADDFTTTSVDYDNYTATVEPDELNFRFNLQTDYMYHPQAQIVATPDGGQTGSSIGIYTYGDISNENIDMSMFQYGLMDMDTVYYDNEDSNTGVTTMYAPYYQAMYKPNKQTNNENDNSNIIAWAKDSDPDFNPDVCIVGVSFEDGIEIEERYTDLKVGMFVNLRDCKEKENSEDGELDFTNDNQLVRLNTEQEGRYYTENDPAEVYIPANTLEIVVAFNPYGLVENNNATYGKVFPITKDLISCVYQNISIDLSDLYGTTIYSIGVRVSENAQYETVTDGNNTTTKHPSIHENDIIGISNISFGAYNIKPYPTYISGDTSAQRWQWKRDNSQVRESIAYVQYKLQKAGDNGTYNGKFVQMPLHQKTNTTNAVYSKTGTILNTLTTTPTITQTIVNNNINADVNINGTNHKYVNNKSDSNEIVFYIDGTDGTGDIFKLEADLNIRVYDYINVQYHIEQINSRTDNAGGEIHKGDIFIDFYDTRNIDETTAPIESLALPAWGKVQQRAEIDNKLVYAWFKKRTDAKKIKYIKIRRENPTKTPLGNIKLHIRNIIFYNANELPALGPQMHMRIYPQKMTSTYNTKIRKFGGIYRLK